MSDYGLFEENIFDKKNATAPARKNPSDGRSGKFLFSYSKMSLYQECPLKYKFKYLDKLPEKPKPYFALGQSIHKALEFFHSRLPVPPLDEIKTRFEKDWKLKNFLEKGYDDEEKERRDLQKGLKILERYHAKHGEEHVLPFLCEYKAEVDVDGLRVIIISDKIEYLGGGRIRIVDYKTGKPGRRKPDQLYLYQKVSELDPALKEKIAEKLGEKVGEVVVDSMLYYYVETLKEVSFQRASDKEIGKFWERALHVAEDINSSKFEPNPGEFQCSFCDFKSHCPVFSDKLAAHKSFPASANFDGEFEETVLHYAALQEKLKELKAEIEDCEKKLNKFFSDNLIVFENADIRVRLEKKEKLEFRDRERTINLLKDGGVYEKTLKPTVQTIMELLSDPDINENLKEEIKSSATVVYQMVSDISRKKGV